MTAIRFYVAGIPKGQPRPKAFARGGHAAVYDPGTAEGWKGQVALAAKPFLGHQPVLDLPLSLRLEFYMPRPKGHYIASTPARGIRESAPGYQTGKPDADNLAKAVMDALTQLNVWRDDSLVSDLRVRKLFDDGRGPGCIIEIREA